jgi:inorganic pyrophosphatase
VSERPIDRADVILPARVVGGLQTSDGGEADDKIVAVLDKDRVWGERSATVNTAPPSSGPLPEDYNGEYG